MLVCQGLLLLLFLWAVFLLAPHAWAEFKSTTEKRFGTIRGKFQRNMSFRTRKVAQEKRHVDVELQDEHGILEALAISGVEGNRMSCERKQQTIRTASKNRIRNPLYELEHALNKLSPKSTSPSDNGSFRHDIPGKVFGKEGPNPSKYDAITSLPGVHRHSARTRAKPMSMDRMRPRKRASSEESRMPQKVERRVHNNLSDIAARKLLQRITISATSNHGVRKHYPVSKSFDFADIDLELQGNRNSSSKGQTHLNVGMSVSNPFYRRVAFTPNERGDSRQLSRPSSQARKKAHAHQRRSDGNPGSKDGSTVIQSPLYSYERPRLSSKQMQSKGGFNQGNSNESFENPLRYI